LCASGRLMTLLGVAAPDSASVRMPLELWRILHAVSCLAAAVTRVNLPSTVYLLCFVAQVSLAPGGGRYCGTRRATTGRAAVLHAWFTQR